MEITRWRKGRPGICIARTSEEEERESAIRFEKQKSMIVPKPYDYNEMVEYLEERCQLEEIEIVPTQIEIFRENLRLRNKYDAEHFSPIFFRVVGKKKDNSPYEPILSQDEEIYVYIEKITGYFETNSTWLSRGLCEVRGVTQEEYDSNSDELHRVIGARYSGLYEGVPIDF